MNIFKKMSILMSIVSSFYSATNANQTLFKQESPTQHSTEKKVIYKNKNKSFFNYRLFLFGIFKGVVSSFFVEKTITIIRNRYKFIKNNRVNREIDWFKKLGGSELDIKNIIYKFKEFEEKTPPYSNYDIKNMVNKFKENNEYFKENQEFNINIKDFGYILNFIIYDKNIDMENSINILSIIFIKILGDKISKKMAYEEKAKIYYIFEKIFENIFNFSDFNNNIDFFSEDFRYDVIHYIENKREPGLFFEKPYDFISDIYFSYLIGNNFFNVKESIKIFDFLLNIDDIKKLKNNYLLFIKFLCIYLIDIETEYGYDYSIEKLRQDNGINDLLKKIFSNFCEG